MQRKTLRKHMWDIFSPLLMRYAVAYIVEMIIIALFSIRYFDGSAEIIETQDQIYNHVANITEQLMPYTIQIGGIAALVTIPFLWVMMKRDRKIEDAAKLLQNKGASVGQYIAAVIMSIAVCIGLNNILLLVNIAEYSAEYQETMEVLYSPSLVVQLIILGIVYPVMEEMIFRGLIFQRMRMHARPVYSIILSSVFFGIYHGNSVQMIYGFLCGLMLAYFYEKFGNLKTPVLAHIVMNITSVLVTYVDGFTWMFAQPIRMAVITIVCAAVGSSMFLVIRSIANSQVQEEMK